MSLILQFLYDDDFTTMSIAHDHSYALTHPDYTHVIDLNGIHSNITIDDNIETMTLTDQSFGCLNYESDCDQEFLKKHLENAFIFYSFIVKFFSRMKYLMLIK